MLQDTELLLTVKRACAIEKNCKAFFWVSSFPLQIFAVLCKNTRTYSLLVSALHYQLCWSTSQIYSRFRQCITVKLNNQLSLGDTLIPHIWKEVSFLMIQGTNYWSPWASQSLNHLYTPYTITKPQPGETGENEDETLQRKSASRVKLKPNRLQIKRIRTSHWLRERKCHKHKNIIKLGLSLECFPFMINDLAQQGWERQSKVPLEPA